MPCIFLLSDFILNPLKDVLNFHLSRKKVTPHIVLARLSVSPSSGCGQKVVEVVGSLSLRNDSSRRGLQRGW